MPENVRDRIKAESQGTYDPVSVQTAHKGWPSASRPVLVSCSDGEQYVIKGSQNGKMLFNEYVCGRLGHLLEAPVAWLRFVDIPSTVRSDPQLARFGPGLALGSLRIPAASERASVQYVTVQQNRTGFAALCILYSWLKANDRQLIYQETPPQLVYSNDHGHFFPGGPNWTQHSLASEGPVVRDNYFDPCNLTSEELAPYWIKLANIKNDEIQMVVSAPPSQWGVSSDDRQALESYLVSRRDQVQASF